MCLIGERNGQIKMIGIKDVGILSSRRTIERTVYISNSCKLVALVSEDDDGDVS